MKLMILCVDGFDPDYAIENGYAKMPYQQKLSIPKECYVDTPDGPVPHTVRVWPTIFSGQVIDYSLIKRSGSRKIIHDLLVKVGITWQGEKKYRLNPAHRHLDTIFKHYLSWTWNIPTIDPEWISSYPGFEEFISYMKKEYIKWQMISRGIIHYPFDIAATYTGILDAWGHYKPTQIDQLYLHFSDFAIKTSKNMPTILISDHGCLDGVHTDNAYFGSTFPIKARSVVEVRRDIERFMHELIK